MRSGAGRSRPLVVIPPDVPEVYSVEYLDNYVNWTIDWDTQPQFDGTLVLVVQSYDGQRYSVSYPKEADAWDAAAQQGPSIQPNGGIVDTWLEVRDANGELVWKGDVYEIDTDD